MQTQHNFIFNTMIWKNRHVLTPKILYHVQCGPWLRKGCSGWLLPDCLSLLQSTTFVHQTADFTKPGQLFLCWKVYKTNARSSFTKLPPYPNPPTPFNPFLQAFLSSMAGRNEGIPGRQVGAIIHLVSLWTTRHSPAFWKVSLEILSQSSHLHEGRG